MKFYEREMESAALERIEFISKDFAQTTVITGRRRIGKTALIKHYLKSIPFVYFFCWTQKRGLALPGTYGNHKRNTR